MGFAKYLKCGRLKINPGAKCLEIGDRDLIIPYDKISAINWGTIYEKYVGQIFEDEGYNVVYHGLNLGLLDQGIDLIAENDSKLCFIQCKFLKRKISKKQIDWILYKASTKLLAEYKNSNKKLCFILIVPDKKTNFSSWVPFNFRLTFTPRKQIRFPILQYYLDHNHIQDKISLEFRGIPMDL